MSVDSAQGARSRKPAMEKIERIRFTVSSLASFDITVFTAILNPPRSGILTEVNLEEKLSLVTR
jgi:pyruvate/2-oxoglutarate dehydrogenase complex dihydrolipoamide acyltransferase (E2) component